MIVGGNRPREERKVGVGVTMATEEVIRGRGEAGMIADNWRNTHTHTYTYYTHMHTHFLTCTYSFTTCILNTFMQTKNP